MELFPNKLNYDFLGKRYYFYALSLFLVALSVYVWTSQGQEKYGVDFLGGHELVVQVNADTSTQEINKILEENGIEDTFAQAFEPGSRQYVIRLRSEEESKTVREKVSAALEKKFGKTVAGKSPEGTEIQTPAFEILKTDFVGPTVGAELRRKALLAVVIGLLGILIFVAIRFEFAFAFGAVVAVFHDVIVSMGVYLFAGHTINMATLAAALTIVGYSVNDTIVIFDRVREELRNSKGRTLSQLVNDSINATLSRTLITQFLTLLAVLSLLIFGGGELSDLSLFLTAGMIAGTYSTIYIASPIMIAWHKFRGGTERV